MKSKFNECFNDFNKALEINPKHNLAKLQLKVQLNSSLLTREDEFNLEKEIQNLEIKINTQFNLMPEAYSLYAQILGEQGLYTKANDYYLKAINLEPLNSSLKVQRALNTMQMLNSFDDAITQLEQVISDDDSCEFAYETLATIEIQRGNLERAAYLFDRAIDISRNKESMINLCSMLIGAKTQFKIFHKYSSQLQSTALNYFNL
jgi:mitochondrial import receptor subunit TOM70